MRDGSTRSLIYGVVALALMLGGCGDAPPDSGGAAAPPGSPAGPSTARTLPIPGASGEIGTPPAATNRQARLVWDLPEGWTAERPASSMRLAQYRVPGPGGEAQCVVYYFGPGQGGDPMSNAVRWAGQFKQDDGTPSRERMIVTPIEGTSVPVQIVEVRGTYDGGMTMTDQPAQAQPGYMLLGGIAIGPDAPWFFKFTGPEKTIEAERERLISIMRSIRIAG